MGALETVLSAYVPLLEALDAGDLEAAAFFLEVAAEAERAAPEEVLGLARELLPPDLALDLELRRVELQLQAVQAARRGLEA